MFRQATRVLLRAPKYRFAPQFISHRFFTNVNIPSPFSPEEIEQDRSQFSQFQIHQSAAANDLKTLQRLLEQSPHDIDSKDPAGNTALHIAATNGNEEAVRFLIKHGADVHAKGVNSYTPLLFAVGGTNSKLGTVKALVEGGALTKEFTYDHMLQSPCCLAIEVNNLEIASYLIEHEPFACPPKYDFRLHLAAGRGHIDLIRQIVKKGLRPDIVDQVSGAQPIHAACLGDQPEAIACLLDLGANLYARGQHNFTVVHYGAMGQGKCLQFILSKAPELVNVVGYDAFTPLHVAVQNENYASAEYLLAAKANPNAQTGDGLTPLHMAASSGNSFCTAALILRVGEISPKAKGAVTPLHLAAMNGHVAVLKQLLDAGAVVEAETDDGQTALDFAFLALYDNENEIPDPSVESPSEDSPTTTQELQRCIEILERRMLDNMNPQDFKKHIDETKQKWKSYK